MHNRAHLPLAILLLAGLLAVAAIGWRVLAGEAGGGAICARVLTGSPASEPTDPPVSLPGAGDAAPLVTEDAPATWSLTGRVTDDLGRPLAGAIVRIGARRAAAGDAGEFVLQGLSALDKGARLVAVAHADWYASDRLEVRGPIAPGDTAPRLEFALDRGASLAGQVLRADGTAVAGARIVAQSNHGRSTLPREPYVADEQCTGWDGRFLFECVEDGTWTVTAEAGGFVGWRVALDVQAGDSATLPPFVLADVASLDGRVVDRSGAPVAKAEVRFAWLGPDGEGDAAPSMGAPVSETRGDGSASRAIVNVPYPRTSAADGSFHVQDLVPGVWRVAAVPPPGMLGPVPGVVRVALGPGAELDVDVPLAEPRRLRGVVVDETGRTLADLQVMAEERGLLAWRRVPLDVRTDPLGRFVFEVAPGADVRLTAEWQARDLFAHQDVGPDDDAVQLVLERRVRQDDGDSGGTSDWGSEPGAPP